jgi:hypothetical protein
MSIVFIGGTHRSGTTLMRSILCGAPGSHPAIPEDRYLRFLAMAYEDSLRWWDRHGRHQFHDTQDLARFSENQIRQYLDHLLERWPGSHHAIIKQPELTYHFPTLARLLNDARFVVLARDPRDIAASLMAVGKKLDEAGMGNAYPRDMELLGKRIEQSYAILFRAKRQIWSGRLAWIQYERLVRDPVGVAQQVASFTGLDLSGYDPEGAWPGWDDGRVAANKLGGNYVSDLWGKAVTDERIGGWRKVLTKDEAETVLKMCPNITKMFGYGKENDGN